MNKEWRSQTEMLSQLRYWQRQEAATISRPEEESGGGVIRSWGHPWKAGTTEPSPAGAGLTEMTWPPLEMKPKEEKKGEKD